MLDHRFIKQEDERMRATGQHLAFALIGILALTMTACTTQPQATAAPVAANWSLAGKTVIDLSHVQDNTMPADPSLKLPTLEWFARVGQGAGAYWNLEVISYCPHTGTHMDSPFHVNNNAGALETVDPKALIGPAIILNVKVPSAEYTLKAEDLKAAEAASGPIQPGDAVLIHTGHDTLWPSKAYIEKYPIFSNEAAQFLVSRKARFVGMETISPDGPNTNTHKILMDGGVLIVENLTNIDKIKGPRCTVIGTFPNIKGASGAYIRLLALQ
ncbi:MAG: cyclase family protein [Armatimonadetes bacterium]|nr:cyclase family protein [Armatimonadota bacterium]